MHLFIHKNKLAMKYILISMSIAIFLISCEKNAEKKSLSSLNSTIQEMQMTDADFNLDTATTPIGNDEINKQKKPIVDRQEPNPDWDKKIIKTANVTIEIKDHKQYYAYFREKIKNLGGYVAQEEQHVSDYKIESTIILKIPVDQFENVVSIVTTGAEKIIEKKISSQDVSTEYVDTRSRIEAKKQFRNRYMDLLKQAKNMEEILNVQSEINNIQEEIESATERLNYLGQSSAFSTINLTYYQVLNSSAKENVTPTFGLQITQSFKIGLGWVGDLFIGLITIWPLILISFILLIIYKKLKPIKAKQV